MIHEKEANLDISVSFKVEFGEATDVATPIHVNSEVTEEINDGGCTLRKGIPEHEWRQYDR
jgi:hypothetical protein